MKRAWLFLIVIFLSACSPINSPEYQALQSTNTALLQDVIDSNNQVLTLQAATPIIKLITSTPLPTPVPTKKPQENYYVETGWCLMMIDNISGNPSEVAGCAATERKQYYMQPTDELTVTFSGDISDRQYYCALFTIDGTFVMADVDTTGSGKAVCHP